MKTLFKKLWRATKRKHLIYRAKKDGVTRHWILDRKIETLSNGNWYVKVFDVNPNTNRPTKKASKFREIIPTRIEKTFFQ